MVGSGERSGLFSPESPFVVCLLSPLLSSFELYLPGGDSWSAWPCTSPCWAMAEFRADTFLFVAAVLPLLDMAPSLDNSSFISS